MGTYFGVTIRVTLVPFPPADSPSKPKIRAVLAHLSLSDLDRRKKRHSNVPGMHSTTA